MSLYGFERNFIHSAATEKPTDDDVYIDILIKNDTGARSIIAKYEQTRSQQIVANPSNYYLSLVRWKVPGFELPLLIFPIEPDQPDILQSVYSVTLETSTDIYQYPLHYVSYNIPPNPPTVANPDPTSSFYFVYNYQQLLDILNHALQVAHDNVTGKPVGSEPPYVIYDPTVKLFSLIAQQSQYSVDISPTPVPPALPTTPPTFDAGIKVYFDFQLYALFNGMPSRTVAEGSAESTFGRDVQILIADYQNNTYNVDYFQIQQTLPSIEYWSPVKQILFITELIPINSEYTAVSSSSFRKILTDFEPITSYSTDVPATYQYFPQGQYRLIDLIGTKPLYSIDLQVKWLDVNGNEHFVLIPPFQQLTAKLLFVKRNLYKTNNLLYDLG